MNRPNVLYPTLIKGCIAGPIRCLASDDSELYLPPATGRLTILPFQHTDGKIYAVTHLQKKATYFSLLFHPFLYHFGKFWRLQQQDAVTGLYLPGTEKGVYFRTPGWRWQKPDAVSNWTSWIFTKGYLGGHLD